MTSFRAIHSLCAVKTGDGDEDPSVTGSSFAVVVRYRDATLYQFAGRNSAIFGADSFARVSGTAAIGQHTGHRTAFNFLSGFGRALQLFQEPSRGIANAFHCVQSLLPMPMKVSKGSGDGTKNLFQIRQQSFRE